MPYKLCKNSGDFVNIPQLIISRIHDTEEDFVRVALFVVSTNNCNTKDIAKALHLKDEQKAKQALMFWKGAGLIENSTEQKQTVEDDDKKQKRAHLTTKEVTNFASKDYAIAFLTQECQRLTGGIITQTDINIYVSMYVVDEMPVDFILLGVAHFASLGKRSARYIERALLSWQREGITTYTKAEKYLKLIEKQQEYVKRAQKAINEPESKVSKTESTIVYDWFEVFKYSEEMIAEAAEIAKEKKSIKYINGILRRWHEQGFKTISDVIRNQNNNMQNITVNNPTAKSVLSGKIRPVPSFKPKGDSEK